jgi:hypothetical protein
MIHTRLALARLLNLIAICILPASEKFLLEAMFETDENIKGRQGYERWKDNSKKKGWVE